MMPEAPSSLGEGYNPTIAAKYYELASGLELSTTQAETRGKLSKEEANAGYQYGRGNLLRSEPKRIKANMNAANSQGLAESGQLAKAQSDTQGEYSQKQLGLSMQRANAIKRANLGVDEAIERRNTGLITGRKTAVAEQNDYNIEHPPPVSTPNTPAGYTSTTSKGGSVSTRPAGPPTVTGGKAQPVTGGLRKAAVKKLKSGWGY